MQEKNTHGTRSRARRSHRGDDSRPRSRRPHNAGRSSGRGGKRKQPTFDPSQFINKNPVTVTEEAYVPKHAFEDFKIDGRLKETLSNMGFTEPSPIQDQAIPEILARKDVVGLAETGTGKTAAFLIPLIELRKKNQKGVTLVLTPTRELAIQVDSELRKLAKNFRFFSTVCVGGVGIYGQIKQLRRRNHFIIGTPGRVKDLMDRGMIPAERIDSVVLDEADRMLDMGFIHDMRTILGELPPERHTLFFSATMDDKTKGLIHDFMKKPVVISVKKKEVTDSIEQDVVHYDARHKYDTLLALLSKPEFSRVIIFGAMKHSVDRLGKELTLSGIKAESIHGNKNHNQRQQSLNRFKSGNARVLVATDVAARGIHVDNVSHVINYDLPGTFEDYVHRIGRTGRGDQRGKALTFVAQ